MAYTATANAFLNTLFNKFILQEVRTKTYENPLAGFKKETLPMGYDAEFIHVNPVTLTDYAQPTAPAYTDPFKTAIPVTFGEYLSVNINKIAEATIYEDTLLDAFTSYEKFDVMVQSIINSLYSGNNIWEYNEIRKLAASNVTAKKVKATEISPVTDLATGQAAIIALLDTVNALTYPTSNYNYAKNGNTPAISFCDVENQRIMMTYAMWDRLLTYNYSSAFHDELIRLKPRVVLVDKIDDAGKIAAIIMDEGYLQFRDRKFSVESIINPADLSINYWLRRRVLSGCVGFANAHALITAAL